MRIMEQSKEKIASILLYLVDIISLLGSYLLSGVLWLVMYKGMDDSTTGTIIGFEIVAFTLSGTPNTVINLLIS